MSVKTLLVLCLSLLLGALLVPGESFAAKKGGAAAVKKGKKGKKGKKAKTAPAVDTDTEPSEDDGSEVEPEDGDVPVAALGVKADSGEGGLLQRSGRMEFDERLVKGQAAQSGAVYLFKRVPRQLPGLVPLRRSYRKRIVEPVLGLRPLMPVVYSALEDGSVTAARPADADVAQPAVAAPPPVPEPPVTKPTGAEPQEEEE